METKKHTDDVMMDSPDDWGRDIVCFGGCDWWIHNPPTEKHWMTRLAPMGHRVLFVNSIGVGIPSLQTPRLLRRVLTKLRSLLRWVRRAQPGILVLTPVIIPAWGVSWIARLNTLLLTLQVRLLMRIMGMRRPLLWAGLPTAAMLLDRIPHRHVVYYMQDDYTAYYDDMRFSRIPRDHARMLTTADRIIIASIGLHEKLRTQHARCVHVPHGVLPAFFLPDLEAPPPPPEALRHIPHPIVGYWGSLEVLQDQELIRMMAEQHPEWSIVFIGRPHYDTTAMEALPNVHFLGYVDLERIPDHGIHFDVGIINWLQTEWVLHSCPVKLREYLALGRPVVSVNILECRDAYPTLVRVTETREDFVRAVEEELALDTPDRRRERRAAVERETWDAVTRTVKAILDELARSG